MKGKRACKDENEVHINQRKKNKNNKSEKSEEK
jgi:hypothetical protein